MATYSFDKMTSVIEGGSSQGKALYSRGNPPSFLGIPPGMTGSSLSFLGSFDGNVFFPVLDYDGRPLSFSTRVPQPAKSSPLVASFAIIPIAQTEALEGIQFLQPVSNVKEAVDQRIEFYFIDDSD